LSHVLPLALDIAVPRIRNALRERVERRLNLLWGPRLFLGRFCVHGTFNSMHVRQDDPSYRHCEHGISLAFLGIEISAQTFTFRALQASHAARLRFRICLLGVPASRSVEGEDILCRLAGKTADLLIYKDLG